MYRSNQQDCSYSVLVCGIRMLRALVDRKKYDQSCLFQTTHTWCLYLAYGVNSLYRYLNGREACYCHVRYWILHLCPYGALWRSFYYLYFFKRKVWVYSRIWLYLECICFYRSNRNRTEHMKTKVTILVLMNAEDRLKFNILRGSNLCLSVFYSTNKIAAGDRQLKET